MKFTARSIESRPRWTNPRDVPLISRSDRGLRSATVERSVFATLAVTAACLLVPFAVRGSEPIDSGWAITPPPSSFDTKRPTSPQVRIAINHFLEQGQMPLLQAPAQQRSARSDDEASLEEVEQSPVDRGAYSTSSDGWFPAHLPTDAANSQRTPQEGILDENIGPRFRPVASSSVRDLDPEDNTNEGIREPEPVVSVVPPAKPAVVEQNDVPAPSNSNASNGERPAAEADAPATKTENPPAAEKPAAKPLPPLSQNMKNLRAKVRRVLKSYYTRPLNSRDNDPWESMHGMLAYGLNSKIRQGSPQGKTITLVGWLCYNRPCKGFTLLYTTPENELRAKQGVGLQGHMGQFLAMLAQCQVSTEYPIRVRDHEFTVQDLIAAEQKTCYPKSELTFKLIALMHYLDSDASWVNDQGASWDIPRLIREELAQPIRGAACGGTHRLSGLSLAARTRVRRGEPLDGEYLRAAQFVEKYHNYAYQMQNRDGSLSTEWLRGRGAEDDTDRRVKTTGHILEWLCYSVNDKEVRSARTFRAVNYLSSLLASNFDHEWEVGPLSHAIHALRLYDERVFQPYDAQEALAKKKTAGKTAKRPSASSRTSAKQKPNSQQR